MHSICDTFVRTLFVPTPSRPVWDSNPRHSASESRSLATKISGPTYVCVYIYIYICIYIYIYMARFWDRKRSRVLIRRMLVGHPFDQDLQEPDRPIRSQAWTVSLIDQSGRRRELWHKGRLEIIRRRRRTIIMIIIINNDNNNKQIIVITIIIIIHVRNGFRPEWVRSRRIGSFPSAAASGVLRSISENSSCFCWAETLARWNPTSCQKDIHN